MSSASQVHVVEPWGPPSSASVGGAVPSEGTVRAGSRSSAKILLFLLVANTALSLYDLYLLSSSVS